MTSNVRLKYRWFRMCTTGPIASGRPMRRSSDPTREGASEGGIDLGSRRSRRWAARAGCESKRCPSCWETGSSASTWSSGDCRLSRTASDCRASRSNHRTRSVAEAVGPTDAFTARTVYCTVLSRYYFLARRAYQSTRRENGNIAVRKGSLTPRIRRRTVLCGAVRRHVTDSVRAATRTVPCHVGSDVKKSL